VPVPCAFNSNHAVDVGSQIVRAYLSRQHFVDIDNSCPMVALPSDVARARQNAKRAFETVFKAMVDVFERGLSNRTSKATAQAIATLCIGGMVVARALDNRALADDLREACMALALQLGGWPKIRDSALKSQFSDTA
jgi:TetR/AcrR family transcriptional regulator, transcriptional repressor for nem operon